MMYCPNCGARNRANVNYCENCGAQLRAAPPPRQQPAPPPSQPIIVTAPGGGGGLFSGCGSTLNLALSALVVGLIGLFVLVFLCVIRLPSGFPIFDPPRPVADLWSRAVAWQTQNCDQPLPAQPAPQQPASPDEDEPEAAPARPVEATLFVEPAIGSKCSHFDMTFSGYAPNETIALEFAFFTDAGVYTAYDKITADGNGEGFYRWNADVTQGGQYMVWGRADSAVGSAVFIVEAEGEGTCACIQAEDAGSCEAAGGEWRHIFVDPGPSFDVCICPGETF